MLKTRNQRRKQRTGISNASSTEGGKRRYLSDTMDFPVGSHLHNHPLTSSHYAVGRAEAVKERQAIVVPLDVNDFHADNIPKASAETWRNRACASPERHSSPPDPPQSYSRASLHHQPALEYPP